MKFLFDNEAFSFETLRTTGFAAYGGADLGEVLSTVSHIAEGDEEGWHQAWKATAQRVAKIGEQALASGHRVSARDAFLRASNYYRTAGDFLLDQPATDPEMTFLSAGQHDTYAAAAALFDHPAEAVFRGWRHGSNLKPPLRRPRNQKEDRTMTKNEQIVRKGYEIAERQDAEGFIATFTPDGAFINEALGTSYQGRDVAIPLMIFAKAFPDMHRDIHRVYVDGDTVVVELSLQGTDNGPLELPMGVIPPTGKKMDAPCCDVFQLKDGKVQTFNCYPSATIMLAQLGVLSNLQASLQSS